MKLAMLHLMPYRKLPADFKEQYRSVWVDVPSHRDGEIDWESDNAEGTRETHHR